MILELASRLQCYISLRQGSDIIQEEDRGVVIGKRDPVSGVPPSQTN
jgi:hypothetical protein